MGRQVTPKGYSIVQTVEVPVEVGAQWVSLFAEDFGGAGGAIADGGTVSVGGVTWTRRGAGVSMSQVAGGIQLTRSSTGKTVLGATIADIDAAYDPRAQYAIVVRAKLDTWPAVNSTHLTAGMWDDDAGTPREMLHAGPYYATIFPANTTMVARREGVGGGFEAEQFQVNNRFTANNYLRWVAHILPGTGITSRFSNDASQEGLPDSSSLWAFGTDGESSINPQVDFAFDTIGIQAYFPAATDVTIERIAVYKRATS